LIQVHTIKSLNNKNNWMQELPHIYQYKHWMLMDLTPPSKDTVWQTVPDPTICCLQEIHLLNRNKHWFRVKGWKIYQANGPPKQAG
jgi:hypothetical protein